MELEPGREANCGNGHAPTEYELYWMKPRMLRETQDPLNGNEISNEANDTVLNPKMNDENSVSSNGLWTCPKGKVLPTPQNKWCGEIMTLLRNTR